MPWKKGGKYTDPITWCANMKGAPRDAVNIFAFSILNRVVMKTPVDTGAARQNWLVTINQETDASDPEKTSGGRVLTNGKKVIESAKGDDKIIIQNNLPYIRMLEFGGYGKAQGQGQALKGRGLSDEARYQKWLRDHHPDKDKFVGKKKESKITADGHSKQAPRGMVGVTMAKADRIWNAVVKALFGDNK